MSNKFLIKILTHSVAYPIPSSQHLLREVKTEHGVIQFRIRQKYWFYYLGSTLLFERFHSGRSTLIRDHFIKNSLILDIGVERRISMT